MSWYLGTTVLWYHCTMVPRYHGGIWHHGTMAPWYHGIMAPWYHGTTVPWYHGTMVPWHVRPLQARGRLLRSLGGGAPQHLGGGSGGQSLQKKTLTFFQCGNRHLEAFEVGPICAFAISVSKSSVPVRRNQAAGYVPNVSTNAHFLESGQGSRGPRLCCRGSRCWIRRVELDQEG